MKRFVVLFMGIVFWSSLSCYGQEKDSLLLRHEISVGVGTASMVDLMAAIGTSGNYKSSLEIHGQYLYNLNKHVGLGGLLVYEHFGYNKRKGHGELISIMPTSRFYWFNNEWFAIYSKVGAGLLVDIEDKVYLGFAFNVTPAALEFGWRNFRVFSEVFPVSPVGILNIGVKYSF